MAAPGASRSLRIVTGEIDSRLVSTRLVIPTASQPVWPPYRRVAESLASRGRQLPTHAHELEEVLTYVTEGFASYQLEGGPVDSLPQGSARLLTAAPKVSHRVGPAQGGPIRWFNVVVGLARDFRGPTRLQSAGPGTPAVDVDNVKVRRLVGPAAPMVSPSGLECQEMVFAQESTSFLRVGDRRRAILYAFAGQGSVDQRSVVAGAAALAEGMPALAVHGDAGFRAIFATAPTEAGASDRAPPVPEP